MNVTLSRYSCTSPIYRWPLTFRSPSIPTYPNVYGTAHYQVLDRTAVILEIFAQHAQSREGQLQVELAMLEYRLTRGPRASGDIDSDKGCGCRGPGETKLGSTQPNSIY